MPGRRLSQVLEYIEAHLDRDLALEHLAAVARFSPSHFKVLFKRSTRMPVHRYVVERRVERARVLLLQGRRTLSEVALEAGFTHSSHMARCMRQVLGASPQEILRLSRD